MNCRNLLLLFMLIIGMGTPSKAQFLKKIKDKVNKAVNTDSGTDNSTEKEKPSPGKEDEKEKSVKWCDTVDVKGEGAGKDGVSHTLAYSSPGAVSIFYDESLIGVGNDSKGYRMILSEKVNNKQQIIVVENGKVIHTDTKVDPKYLPNYSSAGETKDAGAGKNVAMNKYIVGDTLKQDIAKTNASSVTIKKVEDDQFEAAMAVARQSDDYKNMTDEEKKEFEQVARDGVAKNNSMAGTTIPVAAQQGGNVAIVTGYNLVVKGKNYGKFQMPPVVDVSADETKIFAVGVDDKGEPVMIANGKKTLLDKNKYSAFSGYILRSPDLKKFVYVEQKKMSDQEIENMTKSTGNGDIKLSYNIIRNDGSNVMVTDYNASGKFKLTNSGQVISINEKTGQVFADNKAIGKFPVKDGDRLQSDAVLIGNDVSQVALYDGNDGSLTYLDGTVRKLNITFPKVVSENGKSYLSWFRKCGNEIYIARFAY